MSKSFKTGLKWTLWAICLAVTAYQLFGAVVSAGFAIDPSTWPEAAVLAPERLEERQFKWALGALLYGLRGLFFLVVTILLFRRFRKK